MTRSTTFKLNYFSIGIRELPYINPLIFESTCCDYGLVPGMHSSVRCQATINSSSIGIIENCIRISRDERVTMRVIASLSASFVEPNPREFCLCLKQLALFTSIMYITCIHFPCECSIHMEQLEILDLFQWKVPFSIFRLSILLGTYIL